MSSKKKVTAADVMTRDVLTVGADWSVDRLVEFLADHAISGAPVVSATETPLGVVSLTDVARSGELGARHGLAPTFYRHDLVKLVAREEVRSFRVREESETTVGDVMTPVVFSVDENATVQEVAEAMITGRIHRVLVTRKGKLVGIVSAFDLLPLVREL